MIPRAAPVRIFLFSFLPRHIIHVTDYELSLSPVEVCVSNWVRYMYIEMYHE